MTHSKTSEDKGKKQGNNFEPSELQLFLQWYHALVDLHEKLDLHDKIVDLAYLEQVTLKTILPILFCTDTTNNTLPENFIPAYLKRVDIQHWQVLDLHSNIKDDYKWDGEDECIKELFGMEFIRYPKGAYVEYVINTYDIDGNLRKQFSQDWCNSQELIEDNDDNDNNQDNEYDAVGGYIIA